MQKNDENDFLLYKNINYNGSIIKANSLNGETEKISSVMVFYRSKNFI